MKKLIYILLLLPFISFGQTANGTETKQNAFRSLNPQLATTVNFLTTMGVDGTMGKVAPENVTLNIIPPPSNYAPSTPDLSGHLKAIDSRLGQIGNTTAGITNRIYFTGVDTTISAGTFFLSSGTGKGAVAVGAPIPTLTNADNQKQYFSKDVISISQPTAFNAPSGVYTGQLSVQIDQNNGQQRYTIEIYKTDNGGTPIASGITGAPVGNLGVTVVAILDSGLINLVPGNISNISLTGNIASTLSLAVGERLRYHVSAEKVGTAGGDIVMNVFYGSNYNSYYDVTVSQTTDGVQNRSSVVGVTATDALNTLGTLIGYVTPEQFGAIGDGIANDAIAIQNAVNSGKAVLFSAKTYLTNSTISIGLQTELRGYGNSSIIKTTSNLPVFDIQSSGVKINDLQILGSGRASITDYTTTFPLQNGIKISGFYFDIDISKVYFNNLGNSGIYGLDNTVTSSSDIKNGVNVNGCEFRNNLIGVFWDTEFEFNVITNSYFRDNEWGIRIKGGNNAVHGGQVIRNRKGITLEAGLNDAHSVANGVHINQNLDFGIHADGIINGHIFANCVIMFNPVYVNNSIGITFDGGEYKLQTTGFTITNSTNTTVQNINFLATPSLTESGNTRLKFFNNTFVATRPANMAETIDNLEIVNANGGIPLKINTGASTVTNDIVNMPFGSVRFGNSGVSTAFPTLSGKSNNNGGLFFIGATNNTNTFPDMGFDVRENDNTDFADLTKTAFQFSRFTSTPLITVLRNGQSTFLSRVIATGTGNDYNTGALQANGNGAADTVFPTIGFSQPGLYASSIQFKGASGFHFLGFGGVSYVSITSNGLKSISLAGTGTRQVNTLADGTLTPGDIAPTSGTYTPTITNVANVTTITANSGTWTRIGNIVTVTASFSAANTSIATNSSTTVTLPVNRANLSTKSIGSGSQAHGTNSAPYASVIVESSSTTLATLKWFPVNINAGIVVVNFQYDITQ